MSANDVAEAHQARLSEITDTASARALRSWKSMDFADLDGSWARIADEVTVQGVAAQGAAVKLADRYTNRLSREYDFNALDGRIVPESFIGVDGSGRSLGGLLQGAVPTTKEAIGAGLGPRALEAGAAYLAAMMSTAIADISRAANQVSGTAKGYTTYARVVEPGACSRCIVLAGATKFGPFLRHPKCRCTVQAIPGGFDQVKDSGTVFDAMSASEQDRMFGKADAEAIRSGAEVSQVVTARRGARKGISAASKVKGQTGITRLQQATVGYRADGSAIRVYTTSEGATVRGAFGRSARDLGSDTVRLDGSRYTSTSRIRLMPESIMDLTSDPLERRILLQDANYMTAPITRDIRADADAIYRRLGITIG